MAESKIEWTEETWNPIAGCSIVSPGCHNCYAMRMAGRLEAMGQTKYAGTTKDGRWTGKINFDDAALQIPLRKKKPTMWFVNSMSDLFHKDVSFEFIDRVFAVMALCPQHTFQILTKRAERLAEYFDRGMGRCLEVIHLVAREEDLPRRHGTGHLPLPNVWIGVSCEDQKRADERIPHLLKCPAAVRFLSCEPLLCPIDLDSIWPGGMPCPGDGPYVRGIHWCIVGGESGPGARPCDLAWIESIAGQCRAAGVACFVKQLGANPFIDHSPEPSATIARKHGVGPFVAEFLKLKDRKGGDMAEWPADLRVRQFPEARHATL